MARLRVEHNPEQETTEAQSEPFVVFVNDNSKPRYRLSTEEASPQIASVGLAHPEGNLGIRWLWKASAERLGYHDDDGRDRAVVYLGGPIRSGYLADAAGPTSPT